tara:strand:- start:500 stop:1234 length:735 start_codon:yes stop_codon:yes gene_type:complete
MAKTNVPLKVLELLKEVNLTQHQAGWDCHGTWVMYHKAAEKLAGYKKLKFDKPEIIHQNVSQKEVVLLVTGHCNGISEWSFGEATPSNNKNAYPYAMAEKRAKDRVILKLLGFHGDIYTDSEIDDQVQKQLREQAERNKTPPKEVNEQEIDPAPQTDQSPAQYSLEESQAAHSRLSSAIANSESIKYNSDAERGRIIYLQGIFRDNQHILKKMTDEHRTDIQKQFLNMETKLKQIFDKTQLGRS